MRILIATDIYYPNIDGASYFTQRLAEGLLACGHDILVMTPGRTFYSTYSFHNQVKIYGVSSWPTLFHKDYRFCIPILLKRKIKPIIKDFSPEVLHIQGHFFVEKAAVELARDLGIPVIGTNHFLPDNLLHYLHLPKLIERETGRLLWWHFRTVFNRIDLITTPTKTAANILKNIGVKKEVLAVSCGIDLHKFNPKNKNPQLLKHYHLPKDPFLLCVNRLAPEKHIDWFLQIIRQVAQQTPLHLVIAGDGPAKNDLINLTRKLGVSKYVTFLGYVPDELLPNLYPLATAFGIAGTAELQSLATMEAMASGLPIIATDSLALPELVHHGENGYLFKPGDLENLAKNITRIFSDLKLRESMANKSLQIIKAHDINKTIETFEKLYTTLISSI